MDHLSQEESKDVLWISFIVTGFFRGLGFMEGWTWALWTGHVKNLSFKLYKDKAGRWGFVPEHVLGGFIWRVFLKEESRR